MPLLHFRKWKHRCHAHYPHCFHDFLSCFVTDNVDEEDIGDLQLDLLFDFGHFLLRRTIAARQLLKTRIIAQRVEHGIQVEQRGSQRYFATECTPVRYGKQFLQSEDGTIRIARDGRHSRDNLEGKVSIHCVLLWGNGDHGPIGDGERGGFVAEAGVG